MDNTNIIWLTLPYGLESATPILSWDDSRSFRYCQQVLRRKHAVFFHLFSPRVAYSCTRLDYVAD